MEPGSALGLSKAEQGPGLWLQAGGPVLALPLCRQACSPRP